VPRRQPGRPWLSETLLVAALMLLPLLFWWRLWAPAPANRAVIPEGDFSSQYYPLQLFAAREVAQGRLPAWDPYINAGQPGLADIQTGFFYPLNLLSNLVLALLQVPFGLGVLTAQVILHFSLASLFTYLFVRRLARRAGARPSAARFAGCVAALAFTYAGYLTSFPVQQITILETAVWLPLILFFLDLAIERTPSVAPRRAVGAVAPLSWPAILAAMALACAILAGHPQTAMYVVYASLAYGLFLAWPPRHSPVPIPRVQSVRRMVGGVFVPLVLGAALAAIQIVPTLAFIARSTRAGLDYEAVAWGFPLAEITHLLYPGYFGGSPQYAGILPLILAVAALFVKGARRQVTFWIALGTAAFLLSFGGNTILYSLAYLLAPGFGAVRDQERIIYLFGFSVSVLAGYGSLALVQPLPRIVRKGFRRFVRGLAWAGAALLALTALFYMGYLQGAQQGVEVNLFEGVLRHHVLLLLIWAGSLALFALRRTGRASRRWLMILAVGLVWLNLFTVNGQYNLADPVAGGPFPETGLVTFLKEQPGTYRISSAGLLPGGASAGIVYELEDITGNTPLRLDAFQQFEDRLGSWRRWQLLNVQYVLGQQDLEGPGLERVYEEGEVKAYRVRDPLPRAWVVHNTVLAGDDQALEVLDASDFDPRATAVLPPEGKDLALAGGGERGVAAQVVEAAPGRLVLDVTPGADGLLVISQPFCPGWQARVDGERAPIVRADSMLQGVPVTAGRHRVELRYHLSPLPAIVSLAALLVCLAARSLPKAASLRRAGPSPG
jgi:hypothetical protein